MVFCRWFFYCRDNSMVEYSSDTGAVEGSIPSRGTCPRRLMDKPQVFYTCFGSSNLPEGAIKLNDIISYMENLLLLGVGIVSGITLYKVLGLEKSLRKLNVDLMNAGETEWDDEAEDVLYQKAMKIVIKS